jgi:hypothetical protein
MEMPETMERLETTQTPPVAAASPSSRSARASWLSPCPVRGAGWRRAPVEEMLAVAQREARALGLPGHLTVLNGKGWTAEESRLGALMELLERHWSARPAVAWRLARPSELVEELFVPPCASSATATASRSRSSSRPWKTASVGWPPAARPARRQIGGLAAPAGGTNGQQTS